MFASFFISVSKGNRFGTALLDFSADIRLQGTVEINLHADFEEMLVPGSMPGYLRVRTPGGGTQHSRFCPFYTQVEDMPYYMYFDKQSLPVVQW